MRISNIVNLVDGKEYWYVGVLYQCHWEIYVSNDTYKQGNDWSKMIVFDNEQEALKVKDQLQECIAPFIIKSDDEQSV